MCVCVHSTDKEKPILTIFDVNMGEQDLLDPTNFALMKRYVPMLLRDVRLPNPELITSKEHRVRFLFFAHIGTHA